MVRVAQGGFLGTINPEGAVLSLSKQMKGFENFANRFPNPEGGALSIVETDDIIFNLCHPFGVENVMFQDL